jgi:hypothetical protein
MLTTEELKVKLIDVAITNVYTNAGVEFNTSWAEGYISALADHGLISESTFEAVLEFIKNPTEGR